MGEFLRVQPKSPLDTQSPKLVSKLSVYCALEIPHIRVSVPATVDDVATTPARGIARLSAPDTELLAAIAPEMGLCTLTKPDNEEAPETVPEKDLLKPKLPDTEAVAAITPSRGMLIDSLPQLPHVGSGEAYLRVKKKE